ncbi:hypothetical protein BGW39_001012 [Mortierella sp. 14UC]|nr:hypothetical protein BGW39_001012 [Mortierella sp. 14UC]
MAEIQAQIVEETQETVLVSEEATFTTTTTNTITATTDNEPAVLTPEVTEPAPIAPAPIAPAPPVVEVKQAQQSRLSLAFAKISGGCGFCFSPLKSNSTNYHNLVETPADEDGPHHLLPHDDGHGGSSVPVVITEDYKGEHSGHGGDVIIASSSTDSHYLHRTTTEEVHEEVKSRDITTSSTSADAVFEEVTTVIEEHNVIARQEGQQQVDMQEVQFSTQIIDTPAFVEEIVEDVVVDDSTLPIAAAVVEAIQPAQETVAAVKVAPVVVPEPVSPPVSPAATRASGPFAKLTKAKRSPSASLTPSPSSSSTSPLRERLGRFAKIIRPSETSSSISSKFESLKVSTVPSTPAAAEMPVAVVAATAITAEPEQEIVSTQIVEDKAAAGVPLTPVSPVLKELSVPSFRSDATPSLPPQPQQQSFNNSRSNSLAVDTLVANNNGATTTTTSTTTTTTITSNTTSSSSPVAIPSSWANSPRTLHQNDASTANSSSGQSLSRAGRASTMDSATEAGGSEAASLNSNSNKSNSNDHISSLGTSAPTGKDGVSPIKANRRKSVLKKLGKIMNTMNTNSRKNSMDGNESRKSSMDKNESRKSSMDKTEKRMSRQGSLTLASPLESDEHFGF